MSSAGNDILAVVAESDGVPWGPIHKILEAMSWDEQIHQSGPCRFAATSLGVEGGIIDSIDSDHAVV
jgi:hypothetical protein